MSAGRYTPCRLATCQKSTGDRVDGFCCASHHETYLRVVTDRLAARAIRQAGSDAATLPSSGVAATFAAAVSSSHGTASAHVRGISSTGPAGCSPARDGSVEPSGSGSPVPPAPIAASVAPLPSL